MVAEVALSREGSMPKSLNLDENLKPFSALEHTLFCRDIDICRDLRTFFLKTLNKKVAFMGKNSVSYRMFFFNWASTEFAKLKRFN